MTIRGKLFLSFGIMLAMVMVIAIAAMVTFLRWQMAAEELADTRKRSVGPERLQAAMIREVGIGIDYLGGEEITESDFGSIDEQVGQLIESLRPADDVAERDHLIGLRQTHDELTWVIDRIRGTKPLLLSEDERDELRRRLREIADEVMDDIATLNQYYRNRVDEGFAAASSAANYATLTIGCAVAVALAQLVALVILMQRWLVKPIAGLKSATTAISRGDLDTRIPVTQSDEWGDLALAVNEMARSLKSLQAELASKERFAALGELGAYTAHNIRNPLAGIRAAIQVMLSELPATSAEMRETMSEIITSVDRLDSWVKGFLEFARPLELRRAPINLNDCLRNVLDIVHGKYIGNGVSIQTELASSLPTIDVDAVLIEQALAALITNACESGADRVIISSQPSANSDGKPTIAIAVADNGRGISEAMQGRLFRVFATDKRGGTGLGLAQAKKIIDLHGGSLELRSSSGNGSVFVIEMPLSPARAADSPSA